MSAIGRALSIASTSGLTPCGKSFLSDEVRSLAVSSASFSAKTISKMFPEVPNPYTASGQVEDIFSAKRDFRLSKPWASAHLK